MRILFDAFWWVDGPPSGQRVVKNIIASWLTEYPDDDVTIAVPDARNSAFQADLESYFPSGIRPVVLELRAPQHGLGMLLEMPLHARRKDFDVVFTHNFTPLTGSALRCTFLHDVLFQEHPEWFTRFERVYFATMTPSARRADIVFTSTQAEAKRIAAYNPALASKLEPVGLALPREFVAVTAQAYPDVTAYRFLLTVGRLNVRKNVVRLAQALISGDPVSQVSPEVPLLVVGSPDGAPPDLGPIQTAIQNGSIRFTGHISDAQLKWLYQHCSLFVFPSLGEGFGIPVLEAGHCGAPAAVSDIPAFREISPPGTVFFDPTSEASISSAIASAPHRREPQAPLQTPFTWAAVVGALRGRMLDH